MSLKCSSPNCPATIFRNEIVLEANAIVCSEGHIVAIDYTPKLNAVVAVVDAWGKGIRDAIANHRTSSSKDFEKIQTSLKEIKDVFGGKSPNVEEI